MNIEDRLRDLITNYYPAFQGKIGEENKKALKTAILELFKEKDKRIAELESKLSDINEAYKRTINEECCEGDDRKHCGCVYFLRAEVRNLQAEIKRLRDAVPEKKELGVEIQTQIQGLRCQKQGWNNCIDEIKKRMGR